MSDERDLNIVITGINGEYISKLAKFLADQFDMYFLDAEALYEFDIQPFTLTYVLRKYGVDYYREKQMDTMKYVASFSNTVISVESGALLYQNNIDTLNKDGLIIYVRQPVDMVYKALAKREYLSKEMYSFHGINKREITERDEILCNVAEIIVEDLEGAEISCCNKVIGEIKKYYGVS